MLCMYYCLIYKCLQVDKLTLIAIGYLLLLLYFRKCSHFVCKKLNKVIQ